SRRLLGDVQPDGALPPVAAPLDVDGVGLVLEVDGAEIALAGVDDHHLAGGAVGLALPGEVRGQEAEGREAPLHGGGSTGHGWAPFDGAGAAPPAPAVLRRRRRVTSRPTPTIAVGDTNTDE